MNLDYFRANIKSELKKAGLTLNSLSEKADLSEDTLRSLIYGKSQDVKLSTISKIADVLDCSIDYLIGRNEWFYDEELLKTINDLSPRSVKSIQTLIKLEQASTQRNLENGETIISILKPTGNFKDSFYYDHTHFMVHDISDYPNSLKELIDIGIYLTTDYFEPYYYQNDILLLSTHTKPEFNDVVVYQDNDGRIYIRTYTRMGLEPLNNFGVNIKVKEVNQYNFLGVVVKVSKEFDIEQYR